MAVQPLVRSSLGSGEICIGRATELVDMEDSPEHFLRGRACNDYDQHKDRQEFKPKRVSLARRIAALRKSQGATRGYAATHRKTARHDAPHHAGFVFHTLCA